MGAKIRRTLLSWLALSPLLAASLFPFAVLISSAFKPESEIIEHPARWLPRDPAPENFATMWGAVNFGGALVNTVYVCAASVLVCLLLATPLSYALSRGNFRGMEACRNFLLTTQMISPMVLVIGLFQLASRTGLVDSLNILVLIYPGFFLAFAAWMLKSYFDTLPRELEDAARLEGAGAARVMADVVLPLAAPALATAAIVTFINSWNEFVIALTMLRSSDNYTLPIQIFAQVGGRYVVDWHHVMSATLLATLPVAVMFLLLQKYIARGLTLGAVK